MRVIALVLTCIAFQASALADVYQVQHRRASSIVAMVSMNPKGRTYVVSGGVGLVKDGITLRANDEAGTITIDGPKNAVDETKRILAEFDVASAMVRVHITVKSKADKYESTTLTEIPNNQSWMLQDGVTGLMLQISPRINGDGTITGSLDFRTKDSHLGIVTRMGSGKSFTYPQGSYGPPETKATDPTFSLPCEVTVQFELVKSPEGKINPAKH